MATAKSDKKILCPVCKQRLIGITIKQHREIEDEDGNKICTGKKICPFEGCGEEYGIYMSLKRHCARTGCATEKEAVEWSKKKRVETRQAVKIKLEEAEIKQEEVEMKEERAEKAKIKEEEVRVEVVVSSGSEEEGEESESSEEEGNESESEEMEEEGEGEESDSESPPPTPPPKRRVGSKKVVRFDMDIIDNDEDSDNVDVSDVDDDSDDEMDEESDENSLGPSSDSDKKSLVDIMVAEYLAEWNSYLEEGSFGSAHCPDFVMERRLHSIRSRTTSPPSPYPLYLPSRCPIREVETPEEASMVGWRWKGQGVKGKKW